VQVDAMLCDYVQPGGDGKLYVVGAGATAFLTAARDPSFELRFGLACTVHVPIAQAGSPHEIAVYVEGADGNHVPLLVTPNPEPAPVITGMLRVPPPPQEATADAVHVDPFCVMLHLRLERPGVYEVVVAVDNEEQRRLPFLAGLVPAPGQV
jgi:hypothetical protein